MALQNTCALETELSLRLRVHWLFYWKYTRCGKYSSHFRSMPSGTKTMQLFREASARLPDKQTPTATIKKHHALIVNLFDDSKDETNKSSDCMVHGLSLSVWWLGSTVVLLNQRGTCCCINKISLFSSTAPTVTHQVHICIYLTYRQQYNSLNRSEKGKQLKQSSDIFMEDSWICRTEMTWQGQQENRWQASKIFNRL